MKTTVKGNPISLVLGTREEYINDYIQLFKRYFNQAAHHHTTHHSINRDAILVYSYFPVEINCGGCSQKSFVLEIPKMCKDETGAAFYEERIRDVPCSRLVRVMYGGSLLGVYCKKNNVFCTTDIAHTKGNEKHIKNILSFMEAMGLLKPIDNPQLPKKTITLGTDPEMESMIDGVVVPGNNLPTFGTYEKTYISWDGARMQREIRPDPSSDPDELVENIRDLIKVASFFGEDLSVLGQRFPLGGHIHIGGTVPSSEVIQVLDYFLSPFNDFSSEERKKSKYGKKGDFRYQPHGFEYRTPPSAWLLTPKLAKKTLILTKTVVETLINGKDIDIYENYNEEEYRESLKQFGFDDEWITDFLKEIEWAKANMHEPLAKLWGVEIPREFRTKKQYRFKDSRPTFVQQVHTIEEFSPEVEASPEPNQEEEYEDNEP